MMLEHEQNYFTSSKHRISEPMIKQFGNLKGAYSLCNKPLESVAYLAIVYGIDVTDNNNNNNTTTYKAP